MAFSRAGVERETGLEPATPSLEGLCSSQLSYSRLKLFCVCLHGLRSEPEPVRGWRGEDSNLRRREPTGLQPVPVDRFGTSPRKILSPSSPIAPERTREQKDPAPPSPPKIPGGAGANLSLFCVAVSRPDVDLRWRVRGQEARASLRHAARSWRGDSNLQPADYKSAALPIELRQRKPRLYQEVSALPARFAPAPRRRISAVLTRK